MCIRDRSEGLAIETEGELIRTTPPVIPAKNLQRLPIIGRSLRDLGRTVSKNLAAIDSTELLPEVRAFTPFLRPETVDEAKIELRLLTQEFHEKARELIRNLEDPDKIAGDEIGLGLYVFHNQR